MVAPLRRAKLADTAAASFLLLAYSLVPFVILLSNRSLVSAPGSRIAYTVCLALSWPLLLFGGIPLLYYWRKDRNIDREFFSTASFANLTIIFIGTVAITAGCIALVAGQIVGIIDLLRDGISWIIIISALAIALLCFITNLVVQTAREVWAVRRDLRDTPVDITGTVNAAKVDERVLGSI